MTIGVQIWYTGEELLLHLSILVFNQISHIIRPLICYVLFTVISNRRSLDIFL